ncbi:xanthine dehydrogenase accessory protein XdhC [soil metagenome]
MQWLAEITACDKPAILVTVASVEGSAPREAGAKMLVTPDRQFDTIGGGHLELCAVDFARKMLAAPANELRSQRQLERFPLGPTLGQCCGGVVHLAFERVGRGASEFFADLRQRWQSGEQWWRRIAIDSTAPSTLMPPEDVRESGLSNACLLRRDEDGNRWLLDPCLPYRPRLFLFGAGHVGAALVRALAELPCRVTWIDEREDVFPAQVPENVRCEVSDRAEAIIDTAPSGASFLVMTHSHPLDQGLAESILQRQEKRGDIGWFGLIGSRTKRIQFERRLLARGISKAHLEEMICPIGIADIQGKQPAIIALSVAAQLLQVWEQQQGVERRDQTARLENAG